MEGARVRGRGVVRTPGFAGRGLPGCAAVIFTYSDGRKIKLAFLGAEYAKDNPSPPTLRMSYNEDKLVRR
jgi:hypothetical protein